MQANTECDPYKQIGRDHNCEDARHSARTREMYPRIRALNGFGKIGCKSATPIRNALQIDCRLTMRRRFQFDRSKGPQCMQRQLFRGRLRSIPDERFKMLSLAVTFLEVER